jgi:hypothetical protein
MEALLILKQNEYHKIIDVLHDVTIRQFLTLTNYLSREIVPLRVSERSK